jgi:hypothetical protein
MILCITHAGRTTEHSFIMNDVDLDDAYIRSLAEEVREMPKGTLQGFVVDRLSGTDGELRAYVRPKVPFGTADKPFFRSMDGADACKMATLEMQLEVAMEALLQYSTSPTSGDRARDALAQIAALDEGTC